MPFIWGLASATKASLRACSTSPSKARYFALSSSSSLLSLELISFSSWSSSKCLIDLASGSGLFPISLLAPPPLASSSPVFAWPSIFSCSSTFSCSFATCSSRPTSAVSNLLTLSSSSAVCSWSWLCCGRRLSLECWSLRWSNSDLQESSDDDRCFTSFSNVLLMALRLCFSSTAPSFSFFSASMVLVSCAICFVSFLYSLDLIFSPPFSTSTSSKSGLESARRPFVLAAVVFVAMESSGGIPGCGDQRQQPHGHHLRVQLSHEKHSYKAISTIAGE